ncbi:hypothetical protein QR685DRAFT_244673 [Neurospora intermedia]|uniref:Transmembrane protein n=1 Tax=Neurospora intermedia TaxID=5142 RepID=A0ABR3DCX5_NEUIN
MAVGGRVDSTSSSRERNGMVDAVGREERSRDDALTQRNSRVCFLFCFSLSNKIVGYVSISLVKLSSVCSLKMLSAAVWLSLFVRLFLFFFIFIFFFFLLPNAVPIQPSRGAPFAEKKGSRHVFDVERVDDESGAWPMVMFSYLPIYVCYDPVPLIRLLSMAVRCLNTKLG